MKLRYLFCLASMVFVAASPVTPEEERAMFVQLDVVFKTGGRPSITYKNGPIWLNIRKFTLEGATGSVVVSDFVRAYDEVVYDSVMKICGGSKKIFAKYIDQEIEKQKGIRPK